ncbi:type I-E CRISPR-associated protein Cse2/CasB [Umezawaea beigongshangensis]|uniref:type I-E CRISPR-associated protein Cse2/CasB n=1 Tax=Umezawaea beigongshangensis TaxID=2780383 RepID=UPI001E3BDCA2|nr:type I-E CRISPR-associated protein Cse2/CasB [Umezawaea beigongshangensis]
MDLHTVGTVVHDRIQLLQRGVLDNRAAGVAALARLRRGVGKTPGTVNDILQYTLADEFVDRCAADEPTHAERAAHISLTLYALHQQSKDKPMHQRGWGVGRAVRRLHPEEPGTTPGPVLRRFQALGTSADLDELVHHARGVVQLLRGKEIPLDYALFADDLVRWQRPGGASAVRLRWGREFYRTRPAATDSH